MPSFFEGFDMQVLSIGQKNIFTMEDPVDRDNYCVVMKSGDEYRIHPHCFCGDAKHKLSPKEQASLFVKRVLKHGYVNTGYWTLIGSSDLLHTVMIAHHGHIRAIDIMDEWLKDITF